MHLTQEISVSPSTRTYTERTPGKSTYYKKEIGLAQASNSHHDQGNKASGAHLRKSRCRAFWKGTQWGSTTSTSITVLAAGMNAKMSPSVWPAGASLSSMRSAPAVKE